jgi:DNA invertase Pin-like site-specific DNA recombinase
MKAIYVRTSTDDNDGAAQLHELRQWCEREGWKGVKEYVDRGESGKKESRPEWDRLRADITKGEVREVVCTQLSRIGRSVINVILSLDSLHRSGCRLVLLREQLDYGTAIGRAIATILAAIAALEHEQITERIRSGVRRAQQEGTRSGKPIGRPRVTLSPEFLRLVEYYRKTLGKGWAYTAERLGLPETTLRRAYIATRQKPPEKVE